jgi:hypothetical protein
MDKQIAEHFESEVRESKEVAEFMKNVKDDLYYELPNTGKSLTGKQLKKIYNATRKYKTT